jgi:hypothetical protein
MTCTSRTSRSVIAHHRGNLDQARRLCRAEPPCAEHELPGVGQRPAQHGPRLVRALLPVVREASVVAYHTSHRCPADPCSAAATSCTGKSRAPEHVENFDAIPRPRCATETPVLATNLVRTRRSGASAVKRHADSRDGAHRVRRPRRRGRLSRAAVESAAGARGLGADALRCRNGRTR